MNWNSTQDFGAESYWGSRGTGSTSAAASSGWSWTKSGRRREVSMNDDPYKALVGLGPTSNGRVFKTRYIQTAYNNAVAAAKLDDVNFHTLRHTCASWAVMRGVTLKELQELLGHASPAMTMRYAHLAPERLRTAVTCLEGLAGSQPASVSAQPQRKRLSRPRRRFRSSCEDWLPGLVSNQRLPD